MLRFDYGHVSKEGFQSFLDFYKYLPKSGLEHALTELANLRVSQINGCSYCIDIHFKSLTKEGMDPRKINTVVCWRITDFFTPRERAALNWAEAMTNLGAERDWDAPFAELSAHFGEKEITDLTFSIAHMNAMNRIAISAGRHAEA